MAILILNKSLNRLQVYLQGDYKKQMDALRYSQLLSSRICHDLITPVSAIQSGFELLDPNNIQTDLIDLIHSSVEKALRRLVFFRNAFGATSANGFSTFEVIETLIKNYCDPIKVHLVTHISWQDPEAIEFPLLGRMLLNLTFLICELVPQGGTYTLTITQTDNQLHIGVTLEGFLFEMQQEIKKTLQGQMTEAELTPQTIQAYMTWELMNQLNMQFNLTTSNRSLFEANLVTQSQPLLYEATLF